MGNFGQNELWARPVALKFQTPAFYIISRSGLGKWKKTGSVRILANYSNAKIFKRYPRMPYENWRPAGSENVVVFVAIIFKTRVTAAQSQRSLSSKLCGVKKNEYGYNFSFQVLPFNQPQNIPIWSTLIEYGSKKFKIERVFIFFDATTLQKKSWDLTWLWAAISPV